MTRRQLGLALTSFAAIAGVPVVTPAFAADTVRHGIQIGALGALRTTLPETAAQQDIKYDYKDFRDSTSVLLALEQGELEIGNTTTQHLVRAISEGIPVRWVAGWGGGYNVLVARKGLKVTPGQPASLKTLIASSKQAGKPVSIGVPTGSLQHAKLSVFLKSLAVDPEKDVQIANIPFPNHPRALEAGEVDLAMTLSAFGAIAIDKGDGFLFAHLFGSNFGKQEVGFIVTSKLIGDKPNLIQRIVNSHVAAMNMFIGKPEKQIEFEKKYSRLSDNVIDMQERQFLQYSYRTNVSDIKTMARELHQLGWVKEDYGNKVESYLDLRFLAKATGLSPTDLSQW
jgi:ABC-type nitrate/sulfonate/bicarbonate transport system substrate-binding protein